MKKFFELTNKEHDPKVSYEMLTKYAKEKTKFTDYKMYLESVYKHRIAMQLLEYVNDQRDFEIIQEHKVNDNEVRFKVRFKSLGHLSSSRFLEKYVRLSEDGRKNPGDVFSDEKVWHKGGIYSATHSFRIVKEDGNWKIYGRNIIKEHIGKLQYLGGYMAFTADWDLW